MLDPFACPAPGCDVFPYDTAQDLADHLLRDHAGQPAATPTRFSAPKGSTPGRTAPARELAMASAPTAAPATETVRSFSPGGTRATVTKSRPTGKPCSEKQAAFIRSLLDRKGGPVPDFDTLTSRDASDVIERLLARPDKDRPTVNGREPAPEGFHILDGTVYKVQISKTGNRYAKVLEVSPEGDGTWEYAGARPLRDLSPATVATLEQAQAFGLRYGVCMCCGRTLTNPESIELGIGPICRGKHF